MSGESPKTGEKDDEGEGSKCRRPFVIRKLCSAVEEYEAHTRKRVSINLERLADKLAVSSLGEAVVQGPQLTVIMEELDVVVRVYSNGNIHLQANLRADGERACEIIYALALVDDANQPTTDK